MFIKQILLEQKIFESEADIDDFIIKNEIDEDTVIQSLIFDKEVFKEKSEVIEWTNTHGLFIESEIEEKDDSFRITRYEAMECEFDSFKTIGNLNLVHSSILIDIR